ncbi:type I-E CRISPR-associated protein Cse2/CasB [Actinomyces trachealis]|uniref:type I-E CRISPR-associated protein Cse2/CasB n=1 Tax=Actinomyces trachealis TaxID=2763540 RepID=UPI001892A6DF|nr:type I-E CRISPR-associated protein Cse2/CasB [Actinomyces trachealis]
MSTLDPGTPPQEAEAPPRRRPRRLQEAGRLVDARIGGPAGLQKHYLGNSSQGRAALASLRKAASLAPGELPEVWSLTTVPVPDHASDSPTWEEIAVHTALTLYAVHQQSRAQGMFCPGRGLGHAARELIGPAGEEHPSARARFNALVTSATTTELRHHLRGLVSQLRAKSIPLDHAMLADDLVEFQRPGGAKTVRLRWARQYAHLPTTDKAAPAATPTFFPNHHNLGELI